MAFNRFLKEENNPKLYENTIDGTRERAKAISKHINNENMNILEIGVHKGNFSNELLQQFNPSKLFLVDPWLYVEGIDAWFGGDMPLADGQLIMDNRCNAVKSKFASQIDNGQVVIIRKKSDEAWAELENNFFDIIYIDGNHSSDTVKSDIINSLVKIKPTGKIICDDFHDEEMDSEFFDASTGVNKVQGWNQPPILDGVFPAIRELCENKTIRVTVGRWTLEDGWENMRYPPEDLVADGQCMIEAV